MKLDTTKLKKQLILALPYILVGLLCTNLGDVAGWSHGKETPELKASLDKIRRTASEMITEIDGHLAVLQKEYTWSHLTAKDVKNIECIESAYMSHLRMTEYTFSCEIAGDPLILKLVVSQHDTGEGFSYAMPSTPSCRRIPVPLMSCSKNCRLWAMR